MAPALIIDRNGRIDLAATRLLGRHGVPVHLILPWGRTTASRSRWCRETHVVPSPTGDAREEDQIEAIVGVAERLADRYGERPVMLFTWERYMMMAARHRERLDRVLRLDLNPRQALEDAYDKRLFAERAEAAGLPVPLTVPVASEADLDRAAALDLPVFIKPPTNRTWGDLPKRLGITEKGTRVDEPGRLRDLLGAFLAEGRDVLVQESLEGPDYDHASVHSYRHPETGEILALQTVRRARVYPAHAGLGCYAVSERLDNLVEPSIQALETMGLSGTTSVQWKRDRARGWKILEIGPRVALTMSMGEATGVNVPLVAYRSLAGIEQTVPQQRYGPAWLDVSHDRVSFGTYRETGEWTWASWLRSLLAVRSTAFFNLRDPVPWLHELRRHSTF